MAEEFLCLMAEYCEEDQKKISVWYDALQNAGFRGMQTPNLKHHISLGTFPLDQEEAAKALVRRIARLLAPVQANIRHVGVMPGGRVLFAAPDMTEELVSLQRATGCKKVNGFDWLPHTTMLIDEPNVIAAALPTLMQHFTPIPATIDRLELCAFWPTRHILTVELKGIGQE